MAMIMTTRLEMKDQIDQGGDPYGGLEWDMSHRHEEMLPVIR